MLRSRRLKLYAATLPALVALGAILLWIGRPNPAEWPQYDAFRCRECSSPVSVDPGCPERWGCPQCGFLTFRIHRRFRRATLQDFPNPKAYHRALVASGQREWVTGWEESPGRIWSRAYWKKK